MKKKPRLLASALVFGSILVGAIGYGLSGSGQAVPTWTKDASNVVQLSPKTLALNLASSSVTTGANTATDCVTATWNPGSIGTSTPSNAATSTDIAFSGATTDQICSASMTTATSTGLIVRCIFSAAGTSTVQLLNVSGAAIDPASGTARACRTK